MGLIFYTDAVWPLYPRHTALTLPAAVSGQTPVSLSSGTKLFQTTRHVISAHSRTFGNSADVRDLGDLWGLVRQLWWIWERIGKHSHITQKEFGSWVRKGWMRKWNWFVPMFSLLMNLLFCWNEDLLCQPVCLLDHMDCTGSWIRLCQTLRFTPGLPTNLIYCFLWTLLPLLPLSHFNTIFSIWSHQLRHPVSLSERYLSLSE